MHVFSNPTHITQSNITLGDVCRIREHLQFQESEMSPGLFQDYKHTYIFYVAMMMVRLL